MQFKKGGKEKGMFAKKKCQEQFSGSRVAKSEARPERAVNPLVGLLKRPHIQRALDLASAGWCPRPELNG